MKVFGLVLGVLLLLTGGCVGTYFVTQHTTFKTAYNKGKSSGYDKGYEKGRIDGFGQGSAWSDDWDARNSTPATPAAPTYINVPTSPRHCTTSTYGITNQYSSTDCY